MSTVEQQIDNFFRFYKDLNKKFNFKCYHSKYVSKAFDIPSNLMANIDNCYHFIDTFEALVNSKLFIWVEKGYNASWMYYNYILPTTVFLHYLNLDISNLSQIHIYIVNSKIYELYRENVGGEYTSGINPKTKQNTHLIFIKDSNKENGREISLKSLFHELMHLVDNSDYNGLNDANNINYTHRCHEIKARTISNVFLEFYKRISENYNSLYLTLNAVRLDLDLIADNLMYEINNNYDYIDDFVEERYIYHTNNPDYIDALSENIQLLISIREVNILQNFLTNIEERIY